MDESQKVSPLVENACLLVRCDSKGLHKKPKRGEVGWRIHKEGARPPANDRPNVFWIAFSHSATFRIIKTDQNETKIRPPKQNSTLLAAEGGASVEKPLRITKGAKFEACLKATFLCLFLIFWISSIKEYDKIRNQNVGPCGNLTILNVVAPVSF